MALISGTLLTIALSVGFAVFVALVPPPRRLSTSPPPFFKKTAVQPNLRTVDSLRKITLYFNKTENDEQDFYDYCAAAPFVRANPPEHVTLLAVNVIMRHGDRSPVRFFPFAEQGSSYPCKPSGKQGGKHEELIGKGVIWEGGCSEGELTIRGVEQLETLGRNMKSAYGDIRQIYWRSSEKPYCIMNGIT
jgi:hypothetical protein